MQCVSHAFDTFAEVVKQKYFVFNFLKYFCCVKVMLNASTLFKSIQVPYKIDINILIMY